VELVGFARVLRDLTADDIFEVASDLETMVESTAGQVAATRAVLSIEQSLRCLRRSAQAGLAAHAVAQSVLAAAERSGIELPNDDVTRVARSAASLARGMVAGLVADDAVQYLAGGWTRLIGVRLAAA
jgi:hypothetical protein